MILLAHFGGGVAAPRKFPLGLVRRDPVSAQSARTEAVALGVGAAVGAGVLALSGTALRARTRSPLREGPAVTRTAVTACVVVAQSAVGGSVEASPAALVGVSGGALGNQVGLDVLGVRRKDAPQLKPWSRGSFKFARAALASAGAERNALLQLDRDVYAQSSVGPRLHKWRTLERLATSAV